MRVIYHNWSATKQRPHPQILNGFTSQLVIEFRISERLTGNSFYVKVSPSLQWRRSWGPDPPTFCQCGDPNGPI